VSFSKSDRSTVRSCQVMSQCFKEGKCRSRDDNEQEENLMVFFFFFQSGELSETEVSNIKHSLAHVYSHFHIFIHRAGTRKRTIATTPPTVLFGTAENQFVSLAWGETSRRACGRMDAWRMGRTSALVGKCVVSTRDTDGAARKRVEIRSM
jgi:hypothetical protein